MLERFGETIRLDDCPHHKEKRMNVQVSRGYADFDALERQCACIYYKQYCVLIHHNSDTSLWGKNLGANSSMIIKV